MRKCKTGCLSLQCRKVDTLTEICQTPEGTLRGGKPDQALPWKPWSFIVGFATYLTFMFFILFLGINRSVAFGGLLLERAELIGILLAFVLSFALVLLLGARSREALLSRSLIFCYGALLAVGFFTSRFLDAEIVQNIVFQSLLLGFPGGLMLCSWGRALGEHPMERTLPVVFIAAAFASAGGFILAALTSTITLCLVVVLPLVSALCFRAATVPLPSVKRDDPKASAGAGKTLLENNAPPPLREALRENERSNQLTYRILVGSAVFGVAAGLMETLGSEPGEATAPTLPFALLLFCLYCLAVLQLFGKKMLGRTVRGEAEKSRENPASASGGMVAVLFPPTEPLEGAYRLAVLLMIGGFLFLPTLSLAGIDDAAILLAGYLGISMVLVALFLVMARLRGTCAERSFAAGFFALYLGEVIGIVLANIIDGAWGTSANELQAFGIEGGVLIVCSIAGLAVLYDYLFLFTEHDIHALSVVIAEGDRFERACTELAAKYKLSAREAEILPFALKGRSGERIAKEFFISKNTVETHMRHIYAKCGVANRQQLIDLGERTEQALGRRR